MKKRLIPLFILIAYSAILVNMVVLKNIPSVRIGPLMFRFGGPHEGPANLIPFKTILGYLLSGKGFIIAFVNLAGNIVLLMPIGFLVPFVYRGITWKKSLVLAVAAGFAMEGIEALLHVGIFDIDDVLLNGLGVMAGYWVFTIVAKAARSKKAHTITNTVTAMVAAVVFCGVAFSCNSQRQEGSAQGTDTTRRGDSAKAVTAPGDRQQVVDSAGTAQPNHADSVKDRLSRLPDPCGGTGGTGQIISIGNNTIDIKRRDGVIETIKIAKKTTIKNAAGPLAASDLKTGNRVTVVIGLDPSDSRLASVILVCNQQAGKK